MMVEFLHHGRINKLILNDIGCFIPKAGMERIIKGSGTLAEYSSRKELEASMRENYAPFGIHKEKHWQHIFKYGIKQNEAGKYISTCDRGIGVNIKKESNNLEDINDVNLWDLWKNNLLTAIILRGEKSDILLKETADEMCKQNPNCELVEFAEVGHAPALMDNSQIEAIKRFLVAS